jgi:glutamate 5-kinase
MDPMTGHLAEFRRVVIKIGSALLVDQASGELRRAWLDALAADIADCRRNGQEVVVVSSGAIALGRRSLGLSGADLRLEDSQAAAATGQIRLAHAYQDALAAFDIPVAQILLTSDDTERRRRYLNARNTLRALLDHGSVPVVNENDTVATDEIRFGDNDRLAARVAAMISADCLVLLSDIDGLYSGDPGRDPDATFIDRVERVTPEIEAMAGASGSSVGSGGMVTKLAAAKIAMRAGCRMVIADGKREHPIARLGESGRGTWFTTSATPASARKNWIGGSLKSAGDLIIDEGAQKALRAGKSLLPAGVTAVVGNFQRGDAVSVKLKDGREIARGLSAYSAADAARIMGRHSSDIAGILGYRGREELIHRDDLILI